MVPRFRFEMPNGVYHITNRGVDRRDIVHDDLDRRKWLTCLGRTAVRRRWRLFAYILMTNHFHLFLRIPQKNLSAGMQDFEAEYAQFFNRRHQRTGHLFQDRFHAVLVEYDGHGWELSRYIHLNSVRAKLAGHPDRYPWSSFPAYMDSRLAPEWLDWTTVLGELGRSPSAARLAYRRFVEAGMAAPPANPLDRLRSDSILGSDQFVERMLEQFADQPSLPTSLASRRDVPTEMIVLRVAEFMNTTTEAICRGGRHRNFAREAAIYLCRELTEASRSDLAQMFGGVGKTGITETARRCAERIERQPEFRELLDNVRKRVLDV